jgi:ribosomal protein S27AE
MSKCPKCGSSHIIGPRYERGPYHGQEALRYTCVRCHYSETSQTNDQRRLLDEHAERIGLGAK